MALVNLQKDDALRVIDNGGVRQVEMLVTPEIASRWLQKKATYQRAISDQVVTKYAREMTKGEWVSTPTHMIGISPSGCVVDGQHRLAAIVKSGIAITVWVTFNCPENIFSVIDQGRLRNNAQLAKMNGLKYSSSSHISCINALSWQPNTARSEFNRGSHLVWDREDVMFLLEYYEKELDTVFPSRLGGNDRMRIASFRGALLRILINKPELKDYVVDFLAITSSGLVLENPLTDMSMDMPLKFRNFLLRRKITAAEEKILVFWTTFKAFDHAVAGTTIKHESNLPVRLGDLPQKHRYPIYLDSKPLDCTVRNWLSVKP